MKLVIDVGNTLLKLAVFDGSEMIYLARYKDLNEDILDQLFQQHRQITSGIMASVKDLDDSNLSLLTDRIPMLVLGHKTPLPIEIRYNTPETLGVDRIAAVVGAQKLYPGKNLLVIETGTCFTYDFIDKDGVYHGGSISPGIGLRFAALHNFTDKLPLIGAVRDVELTGKTTETSIQSGVINGIKAEMAGVISMYEGIYENLTIILSGGNLDYFDKNLKNNIFAIPNIVLTGLNIILEFNDKN